MVPIIASFISEGGYFFKARLSKNEDASMAGYIPGRLHPCRARFRFLPAIAKVMLAAANKPNE